MGQWAFLLVAALLASLAAGVSDGAQTFTGKVAGVTDGDTISVLRGGKAVKIRLDGIDCPETGDDFSSKAKRFTASLTLGKEVEVNGKKKDRYGRLIARVLVEETDVPVALVQKGLTWDYLKYSSDPVLARAEATAKSAGVGVWSLPNPLPPWEVRSQRGQGAIARKATAMPKTASTSTDAGVVYHGDLRSRVFHAACCPHYTCKNCVVEFSSRDAAVDAGYRPRGHCKP